MSIKEIERYGCFKTKLREQQVFWRESGASEEVFRFLTESRETERKNDRTFREHNKVSIESSSHQNDTNYSMDDSPLIRYLFGKDYSEIEGGWKLGKYDWLCEAEYEGLSDAAKLLSEDEKELLTLKYKQDMKQGDIAKMLGLSDSGFSKRLAKINGKLKTALLRECKILDGQTSLSSP